MVRSKSRRIRLVVGAVVLALAAGYGATQGPGMFGISTNLPADTDGDGLSDRVELAGWATAIGIAHRTDPL